MHWSDCAVYNAPAYEPGPCSCGWAKARKVWWRKASHLSCIRFSALQMSLEARLCRAFCRDGKASSRVLDLICSLPGPGKHVRPDDPLYPPRKYGAQRFSDSLHRKI